MELDCACRTFIPPTPSVAQLHTARSTNYSYKTVTSSLRCVSSPRSGCSHWCNEEMKRCFLGEFMDYVCVEHCLLFKLAQQFNQPGNSLYELYYYYFYIYFFFSRGKYSSPPKQAVLFLGWRGLLSTAGPAASSRCGGDMERALPSHQARGMPDKIPNHLITG